MVQDDKRQLILEAAVRRFGHFGIGKTTMSEIARDLAFSKALLYYYFPDKSSLYAAALQHVIQQSYAEIAPLIQAVPDCRKAMRLLLDKRIEFVSKFYNLLEYSVGTGKPIPEGLETVFEEARRSQEKLLEIILERGVQTGQLKPVDNLPEMARMLLYAIEGMRFSVLKNTGDRFLPSTEEFDTILQMQIKMLGVFMDGLALQPSQASIRD